MRSNSLIACFAVALLASTPACVEGLCSEEDANCDAWSCADGACRDDDWDNWTDDMADGWEDWTAGLCDRSADCAAGQVCHPESFCVEVVDGCPLRDACLGDPDGYTADWMGIDPLYIGSFSTPEAEGRIELLIDFYEDHVYGEAYVVVEGAQIYRWLNVFVTGTREGDALWGQVIEADAWERTFDATFQARLLSASAIEGDLLIASDEGEREASFALWRVSPCGCEAEATCSGHADCPAGQACRAGACIPVCLDDGDCRDGQVCASDGRCI